MIEQIKETNKIKSDADLRCHWMNFGEMHDTDESLD